MNSNPSLVGTLIGYILVWSVSAVITGVLAARKNRNTLMWAIAGILFPWIAFLVLLFLPRLCPKCQGPLTYDEWREHRCPRCDGVKLEQDSEQKNFVECPACHAMIPPGASKCSRCGWS
jgi:hypothetical protein